MGQVSQKVLDYVKANPGITAAQMKAAHSASEATLLATLAVKGHLRREKPEGGGAFRYYPVAA